MPRAAGATRSPGRGTWLVVAALAAAVFLVYQPAWHGGFIWDDEGHVTTPALRSVQGLWRIWFDVGATVQYYPLLHTAFWLEHRLWGDAVLGYHLLNLALHCLAAFLAWVALRRLRVPGAALAAAVFALHPVHVESVAWIAEQKNTLSAVFYLAALLVYLRFDGSRRRRAWLGALGLFVLAVLTKTVTATLPGALLVVLWWQRGRLEWRRDVLPLVPFIVVGAGMGLLSTWWELEYNRCVGPEFHLTGLQRVLLAGRAAWFHAGKLLWPVDLAFFYPRWELDPAVAWQHAFPLAALALLAVLWALRHRTRGPLAAALFFGGTLFPTLGFFNLYTFRYTFVANHYQYLASLGIIAVLAAGAARWWGRRAVRGRRAGLAAAVALLALLGFLSWRQCHRYADVETLYRTTIAENPTCWMAHTNLGALLADRGAFDEALARHHEAIRLQGTNSALHNNLGRALAGQGRLDEAVASYREAIRLDGTNSAAHDNLAIALAGQGRVAEAIAHFREAVRLDAENGAAHGNLGLTLAALGRPDEAEAHLREAVRLDARDAGARRHLAAVLVATGRVGEALAEFERVLALEPGDVATLKNAAWLRGTHPDPNVRDGAEALRLARRAAESSPGDPECLDVLAAAQAELGSFPEAAATARQAADLARRQGRDALAEAVAARLRLYEAGAPWRDRPVAR